jgi:hypothetical protein
MCPRIGDEPLYFNAACTEVEHMSDYAQFIVADFGLWCSAHVRGRVCLVGHFSRPKMADPLPCRTVQSLAGEVSADYWLPASRDFNAKATTRAALAVPPAARWLVASICLGRRVDRPAPRVHGQARPARRRFRLPVWRFCLVPLVVPR